MSRKYEVEVWYQGKTLMGEIGRLLNSLKWKEVRNGVDSIDFNIDQGVLMDYCNKIGEDPATFLQIKNTDIKLKRNGEYRLGGFVNDFPDPNFNQSNATVSIACDGYLNLLSDQIVQTQIYNQWYTVDIASDLIIGVNDRTNSTLGISIDYDNHFSPKVKRDRTYDNDQIVSDCLVALTSLGDGSNDFDFRFDPFRKFQTFDFNNPTIWPDTIEYPAPRKGIGANSMSVGVVADMANRIIAKGSGSGEDVTARAVADDIPSQKQYGIHEAVVMYNDVKAVDTLKQYAEAELQVRKQPIFLPKPVVNGALFDVGRIHAGDVIRVVNRKSPWFQVDGLFRIEEMEVTVDENMSESVSLTLSNLGVRQTQ